jgi:hypothetical protein
MYAREHYYMNNIIDISFCLLIFMKLQYAEK